jgi:RNA polymerase sigma-54 factor
MQLNISQQMKMSQQMKLAPRMIQSMEILQLPVMALQERVEQELAENVVLENVTSDSDSDSDSDSGSEAPEVELDLSTQPDDTPQNDPDQQELVVDNDHNNEADFERLLEMSSEWPEDNISAGSRPSSNRVDEAGDRQHDVMSNMVTRPQSLHDYLLEQFSFFNCEQRLREFGEYLIQNLDHNGRLQSSLPEIAQVYGGVITMEEAQETLSLIQRLDPLGVGARNVQECLLLQLTAETPYRDVLANLISAHLEDLAENRLPVIQRKTGYSLETIKIAREELRNLNPYPGQGFEVRPVQKVTPDLSVERDENDNYVIKLEDEYTPQLRISKRYVELLRSNPDAQTKEYIKRKIDSAKWLIESIEQRHNTLKRVANAIVNHQTEFLNHGPEAIVPLKMQQVADDVGVHVTTVSRAVDDKWIQTPRGLFPLKRFFGGGTTTAEGEEVAWDIIRLKLKEIVANEDKAHPLSDDALVEKLAAAGYQLARRTVTKYRKAMSIPSSRQRREY